MLAAPQKAISQNRPPPLAPNDPRGESGDRRYDKLQPGQLPLTECLKDTVERVVPYWNESIAPAIKAGKRVLIAAHGNSLRAIVKHLFAVPDDQIVGVEIPTGNPLEIDLDAGLRPVAARYLDEARAAALPPMPGAAG